MQNSSRNALVAFIACELLLCSLMFGTLATTEIASNALPLLAVSFPFAVTAGCLAIWLSRMTHVKAAVLLLSVGLAMLSALILFWLMKWPGIMPMLTSTIMLLVGGSAFLLVNKSRVQKS